jgi:hypothetical protein
VWRAYYVLSADPDPNWFASLALAGLMAWVLPLMAEKLVLSDYLLLFPLSAYYALRSIRPDAGALALVALP